MERIRITAVASISLGRVTGLFFIILVRDPSTDALITVRICVRERGEV